MMLARHFRRCRMPRIPRLHIPGGLYHVILRGNHQQRIFDRDTDYYAFEDLLARALTRYNAYCWMTNHVHLLLTPELTDSVVLLTPDQAKGLEFDSVLIIDPATILTTPLGHNDLYVAMTRATHRLGVLHLGPPPPELAAMREPCSAPDTPRTW